MPSKKKAMKDTSDLMMDAFYAVVDKHNVPVEDQLATLVAMTRVAVLATYGVEEFKRFSLTLRNFAMTSPFQPPVGKTKSPGN